MTRDQFPAIESNSNYYIISNLKNPASSHCKTGRCCTKAENAAWAVLAPCMLGSVHLFPRNKSGQTWLPMKFWNISPPKRCLNNSRNWI